MKMLPVSVAASEPFPVWDLSSPRAGGCAGQEPSGVPKGIVGAQIPLLCASRAAWWPWAGPRGDRDPCVPSTRCPWHKHLPRCGGPLNLGFLLSLLSWLPLSLGWGSGVPRDVAWEGFYSHSRTALCCRQPAWDSLLFFPLFPPIPLLLRRSLSHICSSRAGEGQSCRSDPWRWTLRPFALSMTLPRAKARGSSLPPPAPFHPSSPGPTGAARYPERFLLGLVGRLEQLFGSWARAGGGNAPRAAPS